MDSTNQKRLPAVAHAHCAIAKDGEVIQRQHFCYHVDTIFFEIKESKITRGHNYTLVKKQSRLDVRKYSFSQRTINVWNNLSTDCVQASSVNMFKNKIDKYLVKAGYT